MSANARQGEPKTSPLDQTRRLVISDLHFGNGDDLLHQPEIVELLRPDLEWAEEIIILGDMFELVFGRVEEAVMRARPFCQLLNETVSKVIFVPGNHDHHFVAAAGDERRFQEALGHSDQSPFRVPPAERVLQVLCPDIEITSAYPLLELGGVQYTHGHYITQHLASFGWRMLDRLEWRLSGTKRREAGLAIQDYEALIAPLHEMVYQMAQLPTGREGQVQNERLLVAAAAVLQAPGKVGRQAIDVLRGAVRKVTPGEVTEAVEAAAGPSQAVHAMTVVCENLEIPPGPVVFAHTHAPFLDVSDPFLGQWSFSNTGSWVYDQRERHKPNYREFMWPGTVLRAQGQSLELRCLLEDYSEEDFSRLLDIETKKKRRRRVQRAVDIDIADHHSMS